jgi:nucleoside-diphosphate-sugar epimerase
MADEGFSPVSLRNATAYGASPRLRCDIVLNNLVGWAFATGRVRLKSDGTPWRPLVHVQDIGRAFLAALEAPREAVHGQAFNIGSSTENYRIRDLAEIVESVVPDCRIELAADASPDARDYRVDCTKFTRAVGFTTRHTVREGAEELYDAYRANGLTLDELEGPRYMRIAQVRTLQAAGRLDDRLRRVPSGSPSGS